MDTYIDDQEPTINDNLVVEENEYGTVRVNGQTNYEILKNYKDEYGEEDYVEFLINTETPNPKGIKIKDHVLAEKIKSAGLQL